MNTLELLGLIWLILGVFNIFMLGAYKSILLSIICILISPFIFLVLLGFLWEMFEDWMTDYFDKPDWYETDGE